MARWIVSSEKKTPRSVIGQNYFETLNILKQFLLEIVC
jgi:hypothetical protein